MPIDFSPDRWAEIRRTYRRWWAGELERPIIPLELPIRDPGRKKPDVPLLTQATCADFTLSPEGLIDRIDYELSRRVYLGDAFPYFSLHCFGPGIMAGFLGAKVDNSSGRVWFHPRQIRPIQEIHFEYDPDNVWLQRIKAICRAAMDRWQGQVLLSMTDLGGTLDILSTFRPSQNLPLDLYDHPQEVERLNWEAHALWHRFYQEINDVLQPRNPGYSDWSAIYSDQPSYMLQCDFSFMIGPQMFDRFVKPELAASTEKLARSFYHLDGPGQLPHLDSILTIETLDGVQWVPGAGNPDNAHWLEVYRKIRAAGKLIQIYGNFAVLEAIAAQLGDLRGFQVHVYNGWEDPLPDEKTARRRLAEFGVR